VGPGITRIIIHFMFHILGISTDKLWYFSFFWGAFFAWHFYPQVLPHLSVCVFSFCGRSRKIARTTIKFVEPARPSARMERLGTDWTDFPEIWYLSIFQKNFEKIVFTLKSDKNKGHFTRRPISIFHHISFSFFRMKNVWDKLWRETRNTSFK
jgi:hypothetical protein